MEQRESRQCQEAEWVGLPAGLAVVNAERLGLEGGCGVWLEMWGGGKEAIAESSCAGLPPHPTPCPAPLNAVSI